LKLSVRETEPALSRLRCIPRTLQLTRRSVAALPRDSCYCIGVPESSLDVDDRQLVDRLRPLARRLLDPQSDEQHAAAKGELQGVLEFALCRLMRLSTWTTGLWCDGVGFQQVEQQPDGKLRCVGTAWCADSKDQWSVPIFVELATNGLALASVVLGLGDGSLENLSQHKERSPRVPHNWLVRYRIVAGPQDPQLDPLVVIGQLQQWLSDNPQGRIVGPGWEYMSVEAAHRFVHEEASGSRPVVLESTWLGGGPAIRLVASS
jgi:hypothetical protein